MESDREKYEKFYAAFGMQLKYGVLNDYGAKKELLQDLLLYWSHKQNKLVSLQGIRGRNAGGAEVHLLCQRRKPRSACLSCRSWKSSRKRALMCC